MTNPIKHNVSLLSEDDVFLFNEGRHFRLYEKLGARTTKADGVEGVYFAVWAPNAKLVSVVGDFNSWNPDAHPLRVRGESGIWEGFIPDLGPGGCYKFWIHSNYADYKVEKADPFAVRSEVPPKTASVIADLRYEWQDQKWMEERAARHAAEAPMSIYEVHLGSWMRQLNEARSFLTYRDVAPGLASYVRDLGFTHVEFLPLTEHPFYGSWGYGTTGYFSPTSRYGSPADLMYLIDVLHQHGIGLIMDWVPAHFPTDEHGIQYFDGTHLFEHADTRQGFHPDWKTSIFNYGRPEVQSFLISNALFWLDKYHVDGLRVDAVASMLYLDYSRKQGEWIPNKHGGRENLEALAFLRAFNQTVYKEYPDVQTIAEESTSWPMVSRPTYLGGLGFGMKWDMGWMHDTLDYLTKDPLYRKHHHHQLTFRQLYAFSENFVLSLSHDEVVHEKRSLLSKMPGDAWQKAANLRLLFGLMYTQPGKKLLFMGGEIGQETEWTHEGSVDWKLLENPLHQGIQSWVRDLNRLYRERPELHELDFQSEGFAWIDCSDSEQGTLSYLRKAKNPEKALLMVFNFTPIPRDGYRIGAPWSGDWKEVLNSDATTYGGSGQGNFGHVRAAPVKVHGHRYSLTLTLPPLSLLILEPKTGAL